MGQAHGTGAASGVRWGPADGAKAGIDRRSGPPLGGPVGLGWWPRCARIVPRESGHLDGLVMGRGWPGVRFVAVLPGGAQASCGPRGAYPSHGDRLAAPLPSRRKGAGAESGGAGGGRGLTGGPSELVRSGSSVRVEPPPAGEPLLPGDCVYGDRRHSEEGTRPAGDAGSRSGRPGRTIGAGRSGSHWPGCLRGLASEWIASPGSWSATASVPCALPLR